MVGRWLYLIQPNYNYHHILLKKWFLIAFIYIIFSNCTIDYFKYSTDITFSFRIIMQTPLCAPHYSFASLINLLDYTLQIWLVTLSQRHWKMWILKFNHFVREVKKAGIIMINVYYYHFNVQRLTRDTYMQVVT